MHANQVDATKHGEFVIKLQYIRDLSVEVPNGLQAFFENSEMEVPSNLEFDYRTVEDDIYEASLRIAVSLRNEATVVYSVEIDYRGVFEIKNMPQDEKEKLLMVQCPNFLYPFARAQIISCVIAAGFSPPILNPVDFFGLYLNRQESK